jgi:ubiquinone/menaquinone biosynthesis C-methylase UbiE
MALAVESKFLNPGKALRAAKVAEGSKVADFGSGSGFFTRAAARLVGPHGVVWAVDAHRDMLSSVKALAAAEGLHNVELSAGDLEYRGGSNLSDESVDLVVASNLLFCAQDKSALIEEVWRVLKKNGRALFIDWKDSFGGLGPHSSHVVTEAAARALCERGGFSIVEEIPAGSYHWGFVARKKS